MTKRLATAATAASVCAWIVLALAATASGQDTAAEHAAKISGVWHFNKDLSSVPPEDPVAEQGGGPPTGRGGPGGGSGQGGRGGAGGAGGGRGGFGGGREDGPSRGNYQQMAQARGLFRSLTDVPDVLTIVATPEIANVTSGDGRVEKYTIDGKKHEVEREARKVEVTTAWNAHVLKQDFAIGSFKVTRTIQATIEGEQLIIAVTEDASGHGSALAPLKFIFDKEGR